MHTFYSSERHRRMFKRFLEAIPELTRDGRRTPHFDALVRDVLLRWHPVYHWRWPMIDHATRFGFAGLPQHDEEVGMSGDRVYVSLPNRCRRTLLPRWIGTVIRLYSGAQVYAPRYAWGEWERRGPENITSSTWFLVLVPDDGIVGCGVVSEVAIALEHFREITVLHQGRPQNVTEMPFEVISQGNLIEHARLKGLIEGVP